MNELQKILLVDDDREIRELLVGRLTTYGFDAVAVESGAAMTEELGKGGYDLVILDIMLKGENGLDLCKEVRSSSRGFKRIPILFLSALNETSDRIVGLEIGADDYLPKPFETRELVARIKAVLRRFEDRASTEDVHESSSELPILRFGEWRLNTAARHLIDPSGLVAPLSAAEYRLLTYFLEHPQQVLTRDQLVEHIAARSPDIYDRSLDAQISRLRAKLKDDARNPEIILTMRGDGYMLAMSVSREGGEDI
ncbi:response regulator transcription factor [Desulfovibrio sp.]|uniref:response regulator n=1 Tax=Desulfovibrio sp. TaxID=885 RepID=UPI0025C5586D|nr:response regulator transcription factor [Desulfovibrio sp.]